MIEWAKATEDDRKTLYKAVRAVAQSTGLRIDTVLARAYKAELGFGDTDGHNFNKGTIARAKAERTYQWIAKHHLQLGQQFAPSLFGRLQSGAWEQLLAHHANRRGLTLKRLDQFGVVEREDEIDKADIAIGLNQPFCLSLSSTISGWGIAYQGYEGAWHPMALGPNKERLVPIQKGGQHLPRRANGEIMRLYERRDTGEHRFAMLVVPEDQKPLLEHFAPEVVPERLKDIAQIYLTIAVIT